MMIRARHARQIRAGIEIGKRDLDAPNGEPSLEDTRTLSRSRLAWRAWEHTWMQYFRRRIQEMTDRLRKDVTP